MRKVKQENSSLFVIKIVYAGVLDRGVWTLARMRLVLCIMTADMLRLVLAFLCFTLMGAGRKVAPLLS